MDGNTTTKNAKGKAGGRTRNFNGYSRNGCSRCKSQRVRCDEQSPECGRCTRAGVKCPGYGQRLRWSTKYEVFKAGTPKRSRQGKDSSPPEVQQTAPVAPAIPSPAIGDQDMSHEVWGSLIDHLCPDLPEFSDLLFANSPPLHELRAEPSVPDFITALPDFGKQQEVLAEQHDVPLQQSTAYWLEERGQGRPNSPSILLRDSQQSPWQTDLILSQPPPGSSPKQTAMILPTKSLNDPSSVLVEFYFKETAQLFSCYDSRMNPFRTTVSRLWSSSPVLYRTLQSMAAASLIDDFPQFGPIGKQLRKEAVHLLETSPGPDMDSLLAMLMLGGSASWHDPRDLGLHFFNRIRRKLGSMPESAFYAGADNNYRFFYESMTYWEMLLSYVAEDDALDPIEDDASSEDSLALQVVPHPWTGFARDTQNTVQRIGRLIRRQRKLAFARRFASAAHIKQLEKDMATASELEQHLVSLSHPVESAVVDPEDGNTPVWHLLTLADVYRSTGLIQLYHVFPDLLRRRLRRESLCLTDGENDTSANSDFPAHVCSDWLTSYALKTLEKVKLIPIESGTRDFQPFILVALSSELRAACPQSSSSISLEGQEMDIASALQGMSFQTIQATRMRHFVKSRLTSFLHILPPKPIHVCLDIVNKTWETMDRHSQLNSQVKTHLGEAAEGFDDIYWMDVMIENGWETTMA